MASFACRLTRTMCSLSTELLAVPSNQIWTWLCARGSESSNKHSINPLHSSCNNSRHSALHSNNSNSRALTNINITAKAASKGKIIRRGKGRVRIKDSTSNSNSSINSNNSSSINSNINNSNSPDPNSVLTLQVKLLPIRGLELLRQQARDHLHQYPQAHQQQWVCLQHQGRMKLFLQLYKLKQTTPCH